MTRFFVGCVALAAVIVAAVTARAEDEVALIAVLKSADSSKSDKAITCKKLAVFGSKDAVPALAPLLNDEELISWARIALEAIPGPEADEALRNAMATLKGRCLIGVINSIAFRRDAAAVPALTKLANDNDAEIASTAAVALGKIASEPAIKALRQLLVSAPDPVRSAVAEGCVVAAERLLAQGKASEAAAIYDEVRKANVPKQRIVEATRGAILAQGPKGIPLLIELLRSDDKKMFQVGLMTARELPGKEVAEAVAAQMANATPERSALLLLVLADRGDATASPAMITAARSGAKPTRIAAIRVLAGSSDTSSLPILLEIAAEDDEEVALAAKAALVEMPGKEVDAQIVERLTGAKGRSLQSLIELVGQRRIDATKTLLKAADDADAQIRLAALAALGETIKQGDLSVLINRVISPKNAEDAPAAEKALRAASVRMPDGEACAAELTAAMSKVPLATRIKFLEILGAMNNAKSLAALSAAAKSDQEELQDAATRLLGETMTLDAGPILLDLAKTLPEGKYKIRAIRGYIRLVRQFNMPDEQRVEMCSKALEAAERAAEQKMVFEVIERYPSVNMLKLASQAAKVPALKADATRAATAIAQKLGGNAAQMQKLLAQIGQNPVKIEIIKAEYGVGDKQKDVTELLRRHVRGLPLIALPSPQYNAAFGGDPAPGIVKQLKIQYRMDGKEGEATFGENAAIMLPVPK
jgi:HEAT repeat protein